VKTHPTYHGRRHRRQPELRLGTFAFVSGGFTFLDADELQVWESQWVTASARIPAGIAVTTTDRVRVLTPLDPSA